MPGGAGGMIFAKKRARGWASKWALMPILASIAVNVGWQPVAWVVAAALAAVIPLVIFALPERPEDAGVRPYGQRGDANAAAALAVNPIARAFTVLGRAAHKRDFWLLSGSFFICGLSTNGLVGTHLIPACIDHGIPEVAAAGLLAAMGIFDLVGTTASGWLSDRYDSRWLLFWYYGLRGLSLALLPFSDFSLTSLSFFAVFYGLDWIATVPPTLKLTTNAFGREDAAVVFGWIAAAHQVGAATATYGAGDLRTVTDGVIGVSPR